MPERTIWCSGSLVISALLELDAAVAGAGLAADQVEQGGLAGAVGADDHAQLVLVDIEVQACRCALKPSKETVRSSTDSTKSWGVMAGAIMVASLWSGLLASQAGGQRVPFAWRRHWAAAPSGERQAGPLSRGVRCAWPARA